jgi:hypothetical protein
MKKSILRFLTLMIALAVVFSSCNLPSSEPGLDEQPPDVQTSVAQTVAAADGAEDQDPDGGPTATSGDPAEGTQTPEPTGTTPPTETDAPTATQEPSETPLPCNAAEFDKDVTVPDGKTFDPGAAFTKTWRLKNVGTCAWTSGYDLVFAGGDAMGGPSAKQLTTDPVEPGETLDVSVDLTAPASAGTYRGNWELRGPEGDTFGIENSSSGVFWVEIEVVEPTETPLVIITVNPGITLVFNPTANLSHTSRGMVWDGYQVRTNANNVGDAFRDGSNLGVQGFITYDLSGIPDGANILSARLVPTDTADTIGNPFSDLGYLRVYVDNYGELKMNDYTPPPVTGAIIRFSSFNKMKNDTDEQSFSSSGIAALESALGSDEFQIRLQFNDQETDNDGNTDMVRANFKLVITYQNP